MTPGASETTASVASPLRWVGGKRWLIPILKNLVGETEIAAYHEPFLGGASVFLALGPFSKAHLSDTNAELISTYEAIREHPTRVANKARAYARDEKTYYEVRAAVPGGMIESAARFLYLNHTSFNGIYRVNQEGTYNVPFGGERIAYIPTPEQLRAVASRLEQATLKADDFAACINRVRAGDLVFLDPPYTVAHNENGFVKYNQRLFSFEDQRRLSELVDEIKKRDAHYILANAAHDSIIELFDKGDLVIKTSRRNSVGGTNAIRGSARELLFTNLETAD